MKRGFSIHDFFNSNAITAAAIEILFFSISKRLQSIESIDFVDFLELNFMNEFIMNMNIFIKFFFHQFFYYFFMFKTISFHNFSFHSFLDRVCLSSFESSSKITHSSLFGLPEISISEEGSNSQSYLSHLIGQLMYPFSRIQITLSIPLHHLQS